MSALEWAAVLVSLKVAVVALLMDAAVGLPLAWLLARRDFRGRSPLDAAVGLPLVLPPVVTGFALLWLLSPGGAVGAVWTRLFGTTPLFHWSAASLAAAVVALPLFVRAVRASLETVDPGLERAAANLGASPWRVARTITLPLARPGIVAGSLLAFSRALGEFGATILVAGNIPGKTQTIPLAIFSLTQTEDLSRIVPLVLVITVASFAMVLVANRFARRSS